MNVIHLAAARAKMRAGQLGHWGPDETAELTRLYHTKREQGDATGFAYGETDLHDPQFYVLNSDYAQPCTACVSRLARNDRRWYVIEDGQGSIQAEGDGLHVLVNRICGYWRSARHTLVAALTLCGHQYVGDSPLAENVVAVMDCLSAIA